jgi:GNAT superfamily N-acetyltransferase
MQQPSITLRPAEPTLKDGRAFARYLDMAAEGFFRFMLGPRVADILAEAFLAPQHDLSHQNVTLAERDGVIVGMVSGYSAAQHRRSTRRPLERAAGRLNLRFAVVSVLFAPLMRIIDTTVDGDYYVQAIAVDETLRGEGLGSVLLDAIEARARAAGSKRLALDVAASNENACKVYAHRGWSVDSRWPRRIAIPKLKFLRMKKAL